MENMTTEDLRDGREDAKLTQAQAATKLGVSQPYLSLLEKGHRPVPAPLARKVVKLYGLPATALPLTETPSSADAHDLAEGLAVLGYPGFSHLKAHKKKRNPAELMFVALNQNELESRLTEALPWVVWKFADLDWNWLVTHVKQNALQNRLGFVTDVARRWAQVRGDAAVLLSQHETELDSVRLVREGTLCHDSLTNAEREWLRETRPEEAKHWNLLTDLKPEHLRYAA
jgi:transcriptional regulator with XRE-family HTH domain